MWFLPFFPLFTVTFCWHLVIYGPSWKHIESVAFHCSMFAHVLVVCLPVVETKSPLRWVFGWCQTSGGQEDHGPLLGGCHLWSFHLGLWRWCRLVVALDPHSPSPLPLSKPSWVVLYSTSHRASFGLELQKSCGQTSSNSAAARSHHDDGSSTWDAVQLGIRGLDSSHLQDEWKLLGFFTHLRSQMVRNPFASKWLMGTWRTHDFRIASSILSPYCCIFFRFVLGISLLSWHFAPRVPHEFHLHFRCSGCHRKATSGDLVEIGGTHDLSQRDHPGRWPGFTTWGAVNRR